MSEPLIIANEGSRITFTITYKEFGEIIEALHYYRNMNKKGIRKKEMSDSEWFSQIFDGKVSLKGVMNEMEWTVGLP